MTGGLVDSAVFGELEDNVGADFAAELVATFLSDADTMFDTLAAAVTSQDRDSYRRASHSLKSNAQTFGATLLAEQARDMELSEVIDAGQLANLRVTFEKTAAALRDLVDG